MTNEVQWKCGLPQHSEDHQVGHISSENIRHGQAQLEPSDHPTESHLWKRKKNVRNVTNVSRSRLTWHQFQWHLHPRASLNQVWARNIPQHHCTALHRKDTQTRCYPWLTDASTKATVRRMKYIASNHSLDMIIRPLSSVNSPSIAI